MSLPRLLLVLLLLVGGCGGYEAQREITLDLSVPPDVERLRVFVGNGPLELVGTDGGEISGTAVVSARGFRTEGDAQRTVEAVEVSTGFEDAEGTLLVDMPEIFGVSSIDARLTLRVPRRLVVDVENARDTVHIEQLAVGTVAGANAGVRLVETSGSGVVGTSNALVEARGHAGDLQITTSNGPVRIHHLTGSVSAQTTNAPITASVTPEEGGQVLLQTVGGDLMLSVPADFEGSFFGEAWAGRVSVGNLPIRRTVDEPDRVEGQMGEGTGRIRVFTRNGNIAVTGRDLPEPGLP